jgi:CO dehydrogenase maturation factor
MRIAIAGKGGTGKTTIAGTLARVLGQTGRSVLAVDADSNPNLAFTIGIPPESAQGMLGLPLNLLERRTESDGSARTVFAANPEELVERYGALGPDGVRLVVMGKVNHAGAG